MIKYHEVSYVIKDNTVNISIIKEIINSLFGFGLVINALLFVPQIIKLIKIKDSSELSLLMFGGFLLLQLITILHGIVVSDHILAAGYILSLLTCGTTFVLALWYR